MYNNCEPIVPCGESKIGIPEKVQILTQTIDELNDILTRVGCCLYGNGQTNESVKPKVEIDCLDTAIKNLMDKTSRALDTAYRINGML